MERGRERGGGRGGGVGWGGGGGGGGRWHLGCPSAGGEHAIHRHHSAPLGRRGNIHPCHTDISTLGARDSTPGDLTGWFNNALLDTVRVIGP